MDSLNPKFQRALDRAAESLMRTLGDNLHSLILYGSAVRGDLDSKTSDLNLLIVLEASTPAAHAAIHDAVESSVRIEPFVVQHLGMDRAARVFALKFLSIRRNYRVLHGADPLEDLVVPDELLVLLTEQELRNLRMRTIHAYVTSGQHPLQYQRYLTSNSSRFLIVLSDTLRCGKVALPHRIPDRVAILARTLEVEESVLHDLFALNETTRSMSAETLAHQHACLIEVLNAAVTWMEAKWPKLPI